MDEVSQKTKNPAVVWEASPTAPRAIGAVRQGDP